MLFNISCGFMSFKQTNFPIKNFYTKFIYYTDRKLMTTRISKNNNMSKCLY